MALPKAIQEQVDRAAQMEQQFEEGQAGDQTAPQTQPPAEPTPATEPEVVAHGEPAPTAQPTANLEQQYRTLQGKYDAEVPRLHEQIRQRDAQFAQLQREVEELRHKAAEPERKPEAAVTSKDEDAFGADLIDLARRVAKDEFSKMLGPVLAEIDHRLGPVKQKVETVEQQQVLSSQDRFVQALTQAVPDWETVNTDPAWLTWLTEVDPIAGATRQQALDDAAKKLDARRTAAIFSAFKQTQTPAAAPQQNTQARRELERQAAPQKTKGSVTPVNPAERVWTVQEYQAAFDPRVTQSMPPGEAAKLQAEADKAWDEGRIRP